MRAPARTSSANKKSNGQFFFDTYGPDAPDFLTAIIVTLPKGVRFAAPLTETFTSAVADWDIANGNRGWARGFCDPATQCLLVDFRQPGLQNQFVEFTIGISGDPTGGKIRFIYGPDTFTNVSEIDGSGFAGSQFPDPSTPATFLDATKVAASTSLACTPVSGSCANPKQTGIADGDPRSEGGQLPSGGGGGD